MTQNNLGIALSDQAGRSEGAEASGYWQVGGGVSRGAQGQDARAVAAGLGDDAEQSGHCVERPGGRSEGAEAARLLGESVAAYREALKVRTREQLPQDWAMTQNNLGTALSDRRAERRSGSGAAVGRIGGGVSRGAQGLHARAVAAGLGDDAEQSGHCVERPGGRSEGAEAARLLGEAVAAYREALKVRTREQLPQDWAMTQNNLGNALERLRRAERRGGGGAAAGRSGGGVSRGAEGLVRASSCRRTGR